MAFKPLKSPNDIDLNSDCLIEASAGTGKTYTIENMILRLVTEVGVPLDRILVVTFTEKAAGDMSQRIRKNLRRAARAHPENQVLQQATTKFDEAQISTIHSFCFRLLREFSFEMGLPWTMDNVDDEDVIDLLKILRLRQTWASDPDVATILEEKADKPLGHFLGRLDEAIRLYNAEGGDRIHPDMKSFPGEEAFLSRETDHLDHALDKWKAARGLVSFKDMLVLLSRTLDDPNSPMLETIRSRYSHAFVDEFQDTDPVQWGIFRRAFLESPAHRLYLVGDPKQAIYSFRGGDIHTYLRAREQVRDAGGQLRTLTTNWRSNTVMIDGFNALFSNQDWFPPSDGIEHHQAESPPADQIRNSINTDRSGRGALNLVQLDMEKADPAKKAYASFIAREIQRLMAKGAFVHKEEKRERGLELNDIAILVDRRSDARFVEWALGSINIPTTFYKKQGVYQSDEARQLWCLLSGLADANEAAGFRKVLLTRFFPTTPGEISSASEWSPDHPSRVLVSKWKTLATRRHWTRFFRSIQEDSAIMTRLAARPGWERPITNYRQIIEDLESRATRNQMSLVELVDHLGGLRSEKGELEADQTIHRLETEEPKVQILTIHTAKGLEFPVVFVFGGLTASRTPGVTRYHSGTQGYVIDFSKDATGKENQKRDRDREMRRLYYVAVTRAIHKVYLPLFKGRSGAALGALLKPCLDRVVASCEAQLLAPSDDSPMTPSSRSERVSEAGLPAPTHQIAPIPEMNFGSRRLFKTSFSQLKGQARVRMEAAASPWEPASEERLDNGESDSEIPPPVYKSILPPGTTTGNVLHDILERLEYTRFAEWNNWENAFRDEEVRSLVAWAMRRHGMGELEGCEPGEGGRSREIVRMIDTAMRVNLPNDHGEPFSLCQVKDRLTEPEFTVGMDHRDKNCELGGFVDLIFRLPNGDGSWRYHLLDWKTNTLSGYTSSDLNYMMMSANYSLQCEIYLHAMDRWLAERLGADYSRERNLGGAYYLFLRGMRTGSMEGIWHRPAPTTEQFDEITRSIRIALYDGGAW